MDPSLAPDAEGFGDCDARPAIAEGWQCGVDATRRVVAGRFGRRGADRAIAKLSGSGRHPILDLRLFLRTRLRLRRHQL